MGSGDGLAQYPGPLYGGRVSAPIDERSRRIYSQWRVRLSAFRMLETQVTFGQYGAFDSAHPQHRFSDDPSTESNHPVNCVSWWAAYLFARWCGAKLPSEAQWEYACRAGSTTPWSHCDTEAEVHTFAWYEANSGGKTHPVGLKQANGFGLFDMHGNVWEWCNDWWAGGYPSPELIESDPTGPTYGTWRVWRGGSYLLDATRCQSAYRNYLKPRDRRPYLGFRLASPGPV
jgi:sulfatase modifying factor 1